MRVTETCSEIQLQVILDHTVVETCSEEEKQHMVLISKWGCDRSQQTQFKQKFQNSTNSDANIFQSSLVPLRLVAMIDGKQTQIIWQNPVLSVRFCRPICICLIK